MIEPPTVIVTVFAWTPPFKGHSRAGGKDGVWLYLARRSFMTGTASGAVADKNE
jgi:hypothetical protein